MGVVKKEEKIDLTKESEESKSEVKHQANMETKPQVDVDPDKEVDLHIPVSNMVNLAKLRGLVNIHFHFYEGSK